MALTFSLILMVLELTAGQFSRAFLRTWLKLSLRRWPEAARGSR